MNTEVRQIKIFILGIVLVSPLFVVFGYFLALFVVWEGDARFLEADRCLDDGGVWEREIARCWYAGQCEDEGGFWFPAESRCVKDKKF